MFVFLHEQLVALSKSNRGFVDTDKLYFLPHLHEFPTRPLPLYESSDQRAILFLARVAHFSCSHNILSSCLFFSLLTTLVEYSTLANSECRYDHQNKWEVHGDMKRKFLKGKALVNTLVFFLYKTRTLRR